MYSLRALIVGVISFCICPFLFYSFGAPVYFLYTLGFMLFFGLIHVQFTNQKKKFVNSLFYNFSTHGMESSQFLPYRLTFFLKIQIVLGHNRRNGRHVCMGPCKNIKELLHKC